MTSSYLVMLVAACGSAPLATPAPVSMPVHAGPAPAPVPPLSCDVAIVRPHELAILHKGAAVTADPTVIALDPADVTWGSDGRVFALALGKPLHALAIAFANTTTIDLPEPEPSKQRGHFLRAAIVAFIDGSIWYERCYGPRDQPMANHCGTYDRIRLDAPGHENDVLGIKRPAERTPRPAPQDPMEPNDTPVTGGGGCSAHAEGDTWKLARDGKLVRDLGPATDVVLSP